MKKKLQGEVLGEIGQALKLGLATYLKDCLYELSKAKEGDVISWKISNPYSELREMKKPQSPERIGYHLIIYRSHFFDFPECPHNININGPSVRIGIEKRLGILMPVVSKEDDRAWMELEKKITGDYPYRLVFISNLAIGADKTREMWKKEGLDSFLWLLEELEKK